MSGDADGKTELDAVAERFLESHRAGRRPSVAEFADRHPHLAADLKRLLPVLITLEQVKPRRDRFAEVGPGSRVGGYRLIARIGRGGMGDVFEAVDEGLGRRVAVKVLRLTGREGEGYRERFRREARVGTRLHHTNIVPVYSACEAGGVLYYAMPLIDGASLDAIVEWVAARRGGDDTPNPIDRLMPAFAGPGYHRWVAHVGAQAADALAHAHRYGVLHRDLKPSNLMLDAAGTVWVLDFGLAKLDDEEQLTASGDTVGTVRYLAPERIDGVCDARGDVYSLGLTLYELLALRPAFDGPANLDLISRITSEPPSPLRAIDPSIPDGLEAVIVKATSKRAIARHPDATSLAADLRRWAE